MVKGLGESAPGAKRTWPTQTLTLEEFASLLRVSDLSTFREPPAVIRTEHQARLIALGYLVDHDGKLHMTTPGRYRLYAGQLAG
jgi:hypothetical protein